MGAAAEIALFGMDPMRFLETTDPFERNIMQGMARAARELQRRHHQELAQEISNRIMKGLSGKSS